MCGPQQPVTMTSLHVYKTPSGTYALNTEDIECTKIDTFIDAGQRLPTVLTSLTLLEDNTISEPLDIILATIHAQLAAHLQEMVGIPHPGVTKVLHRMRRKSK